MKCVTFLSRNRDGVQTLQSDHLSLAPLSPRVQLELRLISLQLKGGHLAQLFTGHDLTLSDPLRPQNSASLSSHSVRTELIINTIYLINLRANSVLIFGSNDDCFILVCFTLPDMKLDIYILKLFTTSNVLDKVSLLQ